MRSPCFVHSQLQGPSFTGWLKAQEVGQETRVEGPPKAVDDVRLVGQGLQEGFVPQPSYDQNYYDEEEETAGSLTKQLAETAVGVREMSKQLGTFFYSQSQNSLPDGLQVVPEYTQTFNPF